MFETNEKIISSSFLFGLTNPFLSKRFNNAFHVNLLIGISYIIAYKKGELISSELFDLEYDLRKQSTIGFPIELEFELNASSYIGFSLSVFGDINKHNSFFGANINLLVGIFNPSQ